MNTKIISVLLVICILSLSINFIWAKYDLLKWNKRTIMLKDYLVDTEQDPEILTNIKPNQAGTYLLHFDNDAVLNNHQQLLEIMANLDMKVGSYIPYNSWVVTSTVDNVQRAKETFGDQLLWATEFYADQKSNGFDHGTFMANQILNDPANVHGEAHIVLDVGQHTKRKQMESTIEDIQETLKTIMNSINNVGKTRMSVLNSQSLMLSVVGLNEGDLAEFYEALLLIPQIHYAHFHSTGKTQKAYAAKLVQSFDNPTQAPMWKDGLNGEGEIIGVGDTGLDTLHCDFFDDRVSVPKLSEMPKEPLAPSKHRKIQSYFGAMDFHDAKEGHGTHVCGLAAGSPHTQRSPKELLGYKSTAYNAKLAFMDLGCESGRGCKCPKSIQCECDVRKNFICPVKPGVVFLPLDLKSGYFPYFKRAGAHIVSSSWGSGFYRDYSFGYSTVSQSIDQYVWDNKDVLPLFAAGNSGAQWGYETLTSEAEAKNVLSIGASQNTFNSFMPRKGLKSNFQPIINALRAALIRKLCNDNLPNFKPSLCRAAQQFKTQKDCCGTAKDQQKCKNSKKPCCGVQKFKIQVGFKCCPRCIHEMLRRGNRRHFSKNNLALFTARGPAKDGRIKPDVVSIGHQLASARAQGPRSKQQCSPETSINQNLVKKSGTSMATPVAASAIALIRQFYRDGFYAKSNPDSKVSGGFVPSAALMKATAILSGRILTGYVHLGSIHKDLPLNFRNGFSMSLQSKNFQGHGAIDLVSVLGKKANLYLPNGDADREIRSHELHHFCFNMPSRQRFRVALVWSDYPSSPSAHINLVNDLDLIVVNPLGEVSYGNGKYSSIRTAISSPDSINNVEVLDFNPETMAYPKGNYRIVIRGHHVPKGPQPYALVVSSPNSMEPVKRVTLSHCPQYTAHSDHFIMNSLARHKKYLLKLGKRTLRELNACRSQDNASCSFLSKQLVSVAKEIKSINSETRHHDE